MLPVISVSQKCETAIEVAATHTDSVFIFVECNQWSNDEIELPRRHYFAVDRLPKSKTISQKGRVAVQLAINHFSVFADDWTENALICAPSALDDETRVDLVSHRQVTTDSLCGEKSA